MAVSFAEPPTVDDHFEGVERPLRIVVWGAYSPIAERLTVELAGPYRSVQVVGDEGELVWLADPERADLVVAVASPGLEAQAVLLRVPLVIVGTSVANVPQRLASRAYAVVARTSELELVLDRFAEHWRLARKAAARREPPRSCARCGRGYNALAARKGVARRFVRFGSVSLCGACVEALRQLIREGAGAVVDAGVRP